MQRQAKYDDAVPVAGSPPPAPGLLPSGGPDHTKGRDRCSRWPSTPVALAPSPVRPSRDPTQLRTPQSVTGLPCRVSQELHHPQAERCERRERPWQDTSCWRYGVLPLRPPREEWCCRCTTPVVIGHEGYDT
eukprot:GHVU01040601.1.p3 GENE.GHVU01040601.1~~GHVU01040601.1.p3  ORF type:complete len:132 (+),score=1.02 GHVU01040601.1:716-1111(+)